MLPTILIGLLVAVVFFAIVGKGIYNRKHHKGGCSLLHGQIYPMTKKPKAKLPNL